MFSACCGRLGWRRATSACSLSSVRSRSIDVAPGALVGGAAESVQHQHLVERASARRDRQR